VHVFYDQLNQEIVPKEQTSNNSNKLLGLLHFLLNLGLRNMTKIICPILEKLYQHILRLTQSYPHSKAAAVAEDLLKNQCRSLADSLAKQSTLKPEEQRTLDQIQALFALH
jgi:hypothetical protein